MARRDETPRDLLFGLLALQVGLIDQEGLINAFSAWTRARGKTLAEILLERGAIDEESRAILVAMAEKQLKLHGGDTEKSLASIAAGPSTREKLAALGDTDLTASVGLVGSHTPSPDATPTMSVGTSTSDGQRFRVLRPHAQGGLGAVFVALDGELNREVALKQILDHHADDPTSRTRFLIEAEITGGLEHPGIVPVYGLGHYGDGRPYYAMRFIRGDSLKEAIAAFHADEVLKRDPGRRSLAMRKLLRRFVDVCNAIDYAHGRGVLHRDLKPGNVIVGRYGETLVVDWGLAKPMGHAGAGPQGDERTLMPSSSSGSAETLPGSAIGTPAYMSPEQAVGDLEKLGPRSDVYSLGATLYCLLTGKAPFEGTDLGAVLRDVQKGAFPPPRQVDPAIDRALEAVCLKAMATRPEDRHATARALADDIELWAADEPTSAWAEPFSVKARRWMRRNRTAVAAASVALLALLFGTGAVLAVQTRANAELKRANAELALAKDREAARFGLAKDAIRLFHGQVGDDLILKEDQFKPLRDKLLQGAADFYGKLEKLLEGQADPASRKSLGQAYFDLGALTWTIGDKPKALEAHRKGLAVREEVAAAKDAPAETRADVARSLNATALVLSGTGRKPEALADSVRARAILEGLGPSGPAADAHRALLARVLRRIGDLSRDFADYARAHLSYDRSLAILSGLVEANPAVAEYRTHLADVLNDLGIIGQAEGRLPEALESYRRSLAISEGLVRDWPGDLNYRADVARLHYNIGMLHSTRGHLPEAMESFLKALAMLDELTRENPAISLYRKELADAHHQIGKLHHKLGQSDEALVSYRRGLAIQEGLVRDHPTVTIYRAKLAASHDDIATLLFGLGDHAGSLDSTRRALAINRKLSEDDPRVLAPLADLAVGYTKLGYINVTLGRFADAIDDFAREAEIREKVAAIATTVPGDRSNLANCLNNIAALLLRMGRTPEARGRLDRAVALLEALARDHPETPEYRWRLAESYLRSGQARSAGGDLAGSAADWKRAMALFRSVPRLIGEYTFLMGCTHAALAGLAGKSGSGISAAEGEAEAVQAMATLRRAVALGWRDLSSYQTEPTLDPLRPRPDFQLLMMDLAFPARPFASGTAGR